MKKEEFLSVASQYYEEFESLKSQPNFYGYGKCFVELWQRLGSEYMEKQLNEASVTENRRKKNAHPVWGSSHIKGKSIYGRRPPWLWNKPLHAGVDDVCGPFRMLCKEWGDTGKVHSGKSQPFTGLPGYGLYGRIFRGRRKAGRTDPSPVIERGCALCRDRRLDDMYPQ
jgi:hypothetical protein